jgi:hypothetical protein
MSENDPGSPEVEIRLNKSKIERVQHEVLEEVESETKRNRPKDIKNEENLF